MQLLKLYLKIKRVFRLLQQFLEIASSVNYENNEMNQQKKKKKEENWAKFNKVCCLEKRISPSADFFFFFFLHISTVEQSLCRVDRLLRKKQQHVADAVIFSTDWAWFTATVIKRLCI